MMKDVLENLSTLKASSSLSSGGCALRLLSVCWSGILVRLAPHPLNVRYYDYDRALIYFPY